MLPRRAHHYLLEGLASTPVVIERLLQDATEDDYDREPDPERFTIREVIAHLADWEQIWMERLSAIRWQDNPRLRGYDEGQFAIDHNYRGTDVAEQLERFRRGRADLLRFLGDLRDDERSRSGLHEEVGTLTIEDLAVLILGHDGYHTKQISEWLQAE